MSVLISMKSVYVYMYTHIVTHIKTACEVYQRTPTVNGITGLCVNSKRWIALSMPLRFAVIKRDSSKICFRSCFSWESFFPCKWVVRLEHKSQTTHFRSSIRVKELPKRENKEAYHVKRECDQEWYMRLYIRFPVLLGI